VSSSLGADFDQLRKDAFAPFVEHMKTVRRQFESDSAAQLPVLRQNRGDVDTAVEQAVLPGRTDVLGIITGLADLTSGDTNRVQIMARRLAQTEDSSTENAAFIDVDTTRH
jgi:hypothetical protein